MDYAAARQHMIDSQIKTNKVTDPSVIEALAGLPREAFVAEAQKKLAYIDRPVAIGAGRRMNEPMVLARLLQTAQLKGGETALVVGAGTGYSAAILSRLVKKVVALESAPELAERAKAIFVAARNRAMSRWLPAISPQGGRRMGRMTSSWSMARRKSCRTALTAQLADRGRLAVVIKDQGVVGRGTMFVKADGGFTAGIFDADTEVLPGFTRPQRFVFCALFGLRTPWSLEGIFDETCRAGWRQPPCSPCWRRTSRRRPTISTRPWARPISPIPTLDAAPRAAPLHR